MLRKSRKRKRLVNEKLKNLKNLELIGGWKEFSWTMSATRNSPKSTWSKSSLVSINLPSSLTPWCQCLWVRNGTREIVTRDWSSPKFWPRLEQSSSLLNIRRTSAWALLKSWSLTERIKRHSVPQQNSEMRLIKNYNYCYKILLILKSKILGFWSRVICIRLSHLLLCRYVEILISLILFVLTNQISSSGFQRRIRPYISVYSRR